MTTSAGVSASRSSASRRSPNHSRCSAIPKVKIMRIATSKRRHPGESIKCSAGERRKESGAKQWARFFSAVFIDLRTFQPNKFITSTAWCPDISTQNHKFPTFPFLCSIPDKSNTNMSSITRIWDARRRISMRASFCFCVMWLACCLQINFVFLSAFREQFPFELVLLKASLHGCHRVGVSLR